MTGFPHARAALAVAALVSVAGCAAPFVESGGVAPRGGVSHKRLLSGDFLEIGPYITVNKNCSVKAQAKITILEQPREGSVSIYRKRADGATFRGSYTRCDNRFYSGQHVRYTSRSGFVGRDRFAFRVTFVNGEVRDIAYELDLVSSR